MVAGRAAGDGLSHHNAFVITTCTPASDPTPELLQSASREARNTALEAALRLSSLNDEPAPVSLALGSHRYRFIQGNLEPNYDVFAGIPPARWPQTSHEFWTAEAGLSEPNCDIPCSLLNDSWAITGAIITLTLDYHDHRGNPYPNLLLTPDGSLTHELTPPRLDVFGRPQPGPEAAPTPANDPQAAWLRATMPLRSAQRANFRIRYLQLLAQYPGHLTFQFDWRT